VNPAAAVLHAVADLALVNIQSDVIHRLHGGASLVFLNQRSLSSAFLHQALLLRPIHSNLPGVENYSRNFTIDSCHVTSADVLAVNPPPDGLAYLDLRPIMR
jgi:hypothetical protein